jgi:hypothetical protein
MSHDHNDRVAERATHLCAAYGCPLLGTSSSSTQGTSEWWCFAHFGANVGGFQTITSIIREVEWLSQAIVDVRTMRPGTHESRAAMARIKHDLELAGRHDLLLQDHERRPQWLVRLETEMRALISAVIQPPPRQSPIAQTVDSNTFGKVEFDLPEMA